METRELVAQPREILGKKVRFLRRQGLVPANVYGHGHESRPIQIDAHELGRLLAAGEGTTLLKLVVDGRSDTVLVKHIQREPRKDVLIHLDLQVVAMTEKLKVDVPVHFVGEAPAVKIKDGMLLHSLTHLSILALPGDLPSHFELDVSVLADFDIALHVKDVPIPPGVEVLTDAEELVVKVLPPTVAAEVEEEAAPIAEAEVSAEDKAEEKREED